MVRYIISFLLITLLCSTLAYADEEEFDISIKRVTGGKATFIDKDNNEVTFEFAEPREEDYITIEDNNKYLSGLNYGPYVVRGKMQENDYYKFLKAGKVTADDAKIIVIKALIDIFRQNRSKPLYDISKMGYSYDKTKTPPLSCSDVLIKGKIYEELGRDKYIEEVANTSYYAFRNRALKKARSVIERYNSSVGFGMKQRDENVLFDILSEYAMYGFYNNKYIIEQITGLEKDGQINLSYLLDFMQYFELATLYPNETDLLLETITIRQEFDNVQEFVNALKLGVEYKISFDYIAFTKGYFDIYNDGVYEMVQIDKFNEYSILNILELVPDSKYSNLYPRLYKLINEPSSKSDTLDYKPLHCTDNVYTGNLHILPYNGVVYILNTSRVDDKIVKIEARTPAFFNTDYGNNYTIDPLINKAGGDTQALNKNLVLHQVSNMGTFSYGNKSQMNGIIYENKITKEPMSPLGDVGKITDMRGEKIMPQDMKARYNISKFDKKNDEKTKEAIVDYIYYLREIADTPFSETSELYFYDISIKEDEPVFLAALYCDVNHIEYLFPVVGKNLKIIDKKLVKPLMDSLGWRHKQAIVNKTDNGIYIGYIHGDNNIFVVNIVDGKAGYNSFPIYDYKDEKKTENYFIEDYLLESNEKLEQKAGIACDSDLYSNSLICSDRSLLSAVAYIKALYKSKIEKNSTMHYPAYIHDSLEDIYANFGSMLDDKCSNNNSYDECMEAILSYENIFKY